MSDAKVIDAARRYAAAARTFAKILRTHGAVDVLFHEARADRLESLRLAALQAYYSERSDEADEAAIGVKGL